MADNSKSSKSSGKTEAQKKEAIAIMAKEGLLSEALDGLNSNTETSSETQPSGNSGKSTFHQEMVARLKRENPGLTDGEIEEMLQVS